MPHTHMQPIRAKDRVRLTRLGHSLHPIFRYFPDSFVRVLM